MPGWPPSKNRSLLNYISRPHRNIMTKAETCVGNTLEDVLEPARLIIAVKSGVSYQERRRSNRDTWIAEAVINLTLTYNKTDIHIPAESELFGTHFNNFAISSGSPYILCIY